MSVKTLQRCSWRIHCHEQNHTLIEDGCQVQLVCLFNVVVKDENIEACMSSYASQVKLHKTENTEGEFVAGMIIIS